MGIFDKRVAFKPFEYPRAAEFVEVMQSSIWNVNEFNFTQDIQDFNTRLTEHEKEVVRRSLLAISQIEVSVKTFWAKLYEHFPKAEFNQLGVMMAYQECFSEDTEFLTADGFKKYSDIDDDTLVAQMDLTTKEITFEKPLGRIRKKYVGDMHLYSDENTNLFVTPNHDIVLVNTDNQEVHKDKSVNGDWSKGYQYITVEFGQNGKEELTWSTANYPAREVVAYDGHVNCFTMSKGTVIVRREGCVAVSGNCVHEQSYSKLLEILHLNGDFEQVLQVPEIKGRVEYLQKYMKGASDNAKQNYALNVALFSAFIENCSLFSQFFIMKSMNYHKGYFKGVDNVISATFLEEDLHANVGAWIIATIREEYPDFFDDDFRKKMIRACHKAYDAELNIVRWILQGQDLEYVTFNMVDNFLKYRFNKSMEMMGYEKLFEVDAEEQKKFEWFNAEVALDKHVDFFNKRPTNYARDLEDVTEDSIFG